MGLLQNLLGNATEVDVDRLEADVTGLLVPGETIVTAFRLIRDLLVFTDKRLLLIDKQGLTGKKRRYTTVPYGSIVTFSKETAGRLDADAEIELILRGGGRMEFEFGRNANIDGAYQALSERVLS